MSENALLAPFKRNVVAVALKSRPELSIYVLELTAGDGIRYSRRLKDVEGDAYVYESLAEHVCDADGNRKLTREEAEKFVDCISGADLKAILAAINAINNLGDASLEQTEKN